MNYSRPSSKISPFLWNNRCSQLQNASKKRGGDAAGDTGCYKYPPHTPPPPPPNIHIPPSLSVESTSARTVYCRVPPLACCALFFHAREGHRLCHRSYNIRECLPADARGAAAIHFISLDCLYHMCRLLQPVQHADDRAQILHVLVGS